MSTAVSTTRKIAETHCVTVLLIGFPSEVKHADEVCTRESVTAFTAIIRTSFINTAASFSPSDENISLTASGAKAYSPTAAGADMANVIKMDLKALFFAP